MEYIFLKFMFSGKSYIQNLSKPRPLSLKTVPDTKASLTILALKSELRHMIWNVNCSNIFREVLVSGIVFKDRGLALTDSG